MPTIKPGYRSTEFWLGLAAVLIGAFLASGILPSDHWAIKVCGILAVALASLGYSISRGQAKSGGPPVASVLLPLLLAAGLGVSGCGTSTAQKMALVATGTNALWTRGYPIADAACKAEATKCVKPGELVVIDACPGAKRCLDALKLAQRLLDTADRAVMVGLPLAAADDPGAAAYLSAALAAYSQAMAALAEWGVAAPGVR